MKNDVKILLETVGSNLEKSLASYPFEDPHAYTLWLGQHYRIVEHTMKMLELACAFSKTESDHMRWFNHLRGEVNHHKLLWQDAKVFGADLTLVAPLAQVTAMVYSVHGGIILKGSHWLIGHAAVLEGMAVTSGAKLARRVSIHGPSKFLKLHAEEDAGDDGHYEDGIKYIESLEDEQKLEVIQSIGATAHLYSTLLQTLQKESMLRQSPHSIEEPKSF